MNRAPEARRRGWRRRLGRGAVLAALGGCLLAGGGCGPAPPTRLDPSRNRLPLDAWVSLLPAEQAEAQACVRVSAPHRSLIFQRSDGRYHGGLVVQVTAWRDGAQVGGGVGEARATVGSLEATRSDTPLEVTAPLVIRGEAPVTLEVAVRVQDASRRWLRELSYSPRALAAMPVWIVAVRPLPGPPAGGDLTLGADADSLELEVALRRRGHAPWPEAGLDLVGEATGAVRGEMVIERRRVPEDLAAGESRTVALAVPASRLPFGRCRVEVLLELSRGTEWVRLPHEPALQVVNLRVPLADTAAWRRHLDWLEGSLSASRRDSLRGLAAAERPAAWAAIWRDLGAAAGLAPAAAEERHLRRIVAADDRFGGDDRGADSDRGRTLIRWGEPASIEVYADGRTAGGVWEVWDYPERGRRIYFFDAHGIGDFRLRREEPLPA